MPVVRDNDRLRRIAARHVSGGRWGVGVSGGADSMATWQIVRKLAGVEVVVLHVDHASRPMSRDDAAFVVEQARRLGDASSVERLEPGATTETAWRRERLRVFGSACHRFDLQGVILGHHLDDLAETVAMRLLRGSPRSGVHGIGGLRRLSVVSNVRLCRPMLGVRRLSLRGFDVEHVHDATNDEPITLRNRLRLALGRNAALESSNDLHRALVRLHVASERAQRELDAATPTWQHLPLEVDTADPLMREAARRWLGGPPSPAAVDRLLSVLQRDGERVVNLPGGLRVRRLGRKHGGGYEVTRLTPPARSSPSPADS